MRFWDGIMGLEHMESSSNSCAISFMSQPFGFTRPLRIKGSRVLGLPDF
jgi:hypothetical protein